uniref:keratin, type II cytoskeletal 80-like n=1 Tax=Euleptes europaea TaxID=460621 RepID=UPI002541E6FB|nr:keratin, type II cytoskeletal 80-like [Euleptes europaea]
MASHRSRDFSSLSSASPTSPGDSFSGRRERSCSPCSRHGACSSPTADLTGRHSFSASNLTRYGVSAYPKVTYNKRLLTPLNLDIDSSIQEIRSKEKDDIKTLNNQFAALIGKVQSLEQHNQVLLARWNFLKEQDNSVSDLDIKLIYDQYMNKLRQQIRSIDAEKEQLDLELDEVLEAMDSFRGKYEGEINKRSAMEFTFTTLKKDLDNGFLHKTELEAKLNGLHAMAELMKTIHDQELEEAMSQIKDVSIVLGIDHKRSNIDPHRIVEEVRAQYEALAIRSWEELEALTRSKLNEGELQSAKYGDHLLNDRRIIAELNIQIQKMRSCILSLKSQCLRLEGTVKEVGTQGEAALNDAKAKLANLEEALQNLRQDLAHLVKEYQELMNIKLALDIEILTYRELMEGEEISMESPAFAFISRISSGPKFPSSQSSVMTASNVASRAREHSADRTSHSRGRQESGLSRSQSGVLKMVVSQWVAFLEVIAGQTGAAQKAGFPEARVITMKTSAAMKVKDMLSPPFPELILRKTVESRLVAFLEVTVRKAEEDVHEEMLSRVPSGATESVPEAGLSRSQSGDSEGPVETSTPISRNDSYVTAVSRRDLSRTYSSEAESPSGGIEAPVGSPADGNETIPQRGLGGSYSREEGLSVTPSGEPASPGSPYLVGEVRSDNLHYPTTEEASYYGEFNAEQ